MTIPQQILRTDAPQDLIAFRSYTERRLNELQRSLSLIFIVKGDPTGVVDAPVGALALRTDGGAGTVLYINETGGVGGWVAK